MPGSKLEGARLVRWHLAGPWTQTWVHSKVEVQTKKFTRDRPLLYRKENESVERQIVLVEKNIPVHSTLSAHSAVHSGAGRRGYLTIQCSGFAAATAATGKDMRIVCLAP